jgi:CBS domain-containing protein
MNSVFGKPRTSKRRDFQKLLNIGQVRTGNLKHELSEDSMRVFDVMSNDVVSVDATEKAFDAVLKMINRDIGSVVVKREGSVVGIITKGDVLRNIVKAGIDPRKTSAADVMSKHVVTVDQDATLESASRLMTKYNVSKLPVMNEGKLVGIITSSDLIKAVPMQVGYLQELVNARFVPHRRR